MTDDILNVALTYKLRLGKTYIEDYLLIQFMMTTQQQNHYKNQYITKYSLNLKQMLPKYDVNMMQLEYVVCFISQEKVSFYQLAQFFNVNVYKILLRYLLYMG